MRGEVSLSRTLASFYWQLAGRIWQDIPLDENGNHTEFERYVGYFLLKTPRFQGPLSDVFLQMAVQTYLEAVESGQEPRAYIRQASRKASALSRRSKPLADIGFEGISGLENRGNDFRWQFRKGFEFSPRDVVEAFMLDNNGPLVDFVLDALVQAQGQSLAGKSALEREIRNAGNTLLRPKVENGFIGQARDRFEAVHDVLKSWFARLKERPTIALGDVVRELKILPRLVPATIFLAVSSSLAAISAYQGLTQVNSPAQVVWTLAVTITLLYAVDVLSYVVHVERDGWGDGAEAKAFQDHHDFPDEAGRWTVGRSVSSTAPVVIPLLLILLLVEPHYSIAIGGAIALMGLLFLTQTHGCAHIDDSDLAGWIRFLQKYHVILPKAPHEHHHDTLTGSYGVFNGWSNALMNRIGYRDFYARLRMRLGGDTPIWVRQLAERAKNPTIETARNNLEQSESPTWEKT